MKSLKISALFLIAICLSSCAVIETVFEAGVWTGVLAVAVVILLIGFLIFKAIKK